MRLLGAFLFAVAIAGSLRADGVAVLSPDGHYFLESFGEGESSVFTIENRRSGGGQITNGHFTSAELDCLKNSVERRARYAVWSPDSKKVAVSVRTGKDIEQTFVLIRHGETFRCEPLPTHDADERMTPLRWLDASKIVVEVSGSWGGRHDESWARSFYALTVTYGLDAKTGRFRRLSKTKRIYPLNDA
jgi:hypothetical protein